MPHNSKSKKSNSINLQAKSSWASEDKFHIVLETATFTEGKYIAS